MKENTNQKIKKQKGFTLIELIVVIAILGILAVMIAPRIVGYTEKAKVSADQTMAQSVANACAVYIADTDPTPTVSGDGLMAGVAGAKLIDSSLTTQAAVAGKLKSTAYGGVTVVQDTTTHEVTVTLTHSGTNTTDFVVVK